VLEGAALESAVAALISVDFDGYAADGRLREGFAQRTAGLDVLALLTEGAVRPRSRAAAA